MEKENKIVLKNERNGHVNKLVNELGSWGFFKVIYRNDMLKILGMNILMLILFVPVGYLAYRYLIQVSQFTSRLPVGNAIGFGYAPWLGVGAEISRLTNLAMSELLLWMLAAGAVVGLSVAGGMAIIRDSFWTGRLKVFKAFGRGIVENGVACVVCFVLLVGCVNGIYHASVAMRAFPHGQAFFAGGYVACVGFSDAVCHDLFKRQFHIQAIRGSKFEECVAYTDALYRIDDFQIYHCFASRSVAFAHLRQCNILVCHSCFRNLRFLLRDFRMAEPHDDYFFHLQSSGKNQDCKKKNAAAQGSG
ncbi:MAG: hypothetical protein ACLTSK_00890 [Christensenellales bacterium]